MIDPVYYLGLSAIMFGAGLLGVMTQRNAVRILISVEIMLNATNVSLIAFNGMFGFGDEITLLYEGWSFVLIIITIAAVEAAIALAIFLSVFRNFGEIEVDNIISLKEPNEVELI